MTTVVSTTLRTESTSAAFVITGPTTAAPYFKLAVHTNVLHALGQRNGQQPGWLTTWRGESYEEALAFAEELAPLVDLGITGHRQWTKASADAATAIYRRVNKTIPRAEGGMG